MRCGLCSRQRDVDLWKAALVGPGEDLDSVRRKVAESDLDIALVVDDGNRPVPISDGLDAKVLTHRDRQPLSGFRVSLLDRVSQRRSNVFKLGM